MLSTTFTVAPIIAALLVMSPPVPTVLAAPTADVAETPRRVRITADSEELGRQGVGLDGLVVEQLGPKLQEAGFEVVDDDSAPITLHVRFEGLRVDEFHYGLHFEFVDGDRVEPAIPWVACMICVDANLRPALDEQAPVLIEALEKRVAAMESAAADHGAGDVTPPGDGDGDDVGPVEPPPKPIGPMGGVGIGVAALGLGAVVWGSVELSRGRVYADADPSDPYRTWVDHKPRGTALLGGGIAGVALGTALVVTDVVLRAKRRKRARNESGVVLPLTSPHGLGVVWVQRF